MTVEAYAKVNLTLEVFGKRADGFHALRSVVLPIGLSDTLTFTPADAFSTDTGYPDDLILKACRTLASTVSLNTPIVPANPNNPNTPNNPDNLFLRPYRITVEKRIPAGGGLGGGSADAAVALLALNELWRLGKTPEELAAIGAHVGSDVPALVLANHYRAPIRMEGRGEVVSLLTPSTASCPLPATSCPLPTTNYQLPATSCPLPATNYQLLLANPGVPCSTAAVFGKYVPRVTGGTEILYTMQQALESRDLGRIASAMMNDLQGPAVAICPEIGAALAALREVGVIGAMMSGSGSTVFGLVPSEAEGRKMATLLNGRGLRAWSVAACPVV